MPSTVSALIAVRRLLYPSASEFNPRTYCTTFFLFYAALLAALRVLDAALATLPQPPLLQPAWEQSLRRYPWLLGHAGFGGLVGLATLVVSCVGFSVLDLRRCMETKLQRGYFPSVRDMCVAGVPQLVVYSYANYAWYVKGYHPVALPPEAPRLPVLAEQVLVAFLVGDFFIYWEHRLMHMVPFTRKHIHSWHHAYTAPFSWAGGVVHPLEILVVVACQIAAPLALSHHPLSFWVFVALWTALLFEEHSGHAVSWAPYHWLPFAACPMGGGAAPHDIHHYKVTKNFSFVLCVWDHLFGSFEPVAPPDQPAPKKATLARPQQPTHKKAT